MTLAVCAAGFAGFPRFLTSPVAVRVFAKAHRVDAGVSVDVPGRHARQRAVFNASTSRSRASMRRLTASM